MKRRTSCRYLRTMKMFDLVNSIIDTSITCRNWWSIHMTKVTLFWWIIIFFWVYWKKERSKKKKKKKVIDYYWIMKITVDMMMIIVLSVHVFVFDLSICMRHLDMCECTRTFVDTIDNSYHSFLVWTYSHAYSFDLFEHNE